MKQNIQKVVSLVRQKTSSYTRVQKSALWLSLFLVVTAAGVVLLRQPQSIKTSGYFNRDVLKTGASPVITKTKSAAKPGAVRADGEIRTAYISNELLVKIEPSAKQKVKPNQGGANTGIDGLNKRAAKNKAKNLTPLVQPTPGADLNNPIYSWYKLSIDLPAQKIEPDTPKAEEIENLAEDYESDPEIAKAEPNFIFKTTAVPNDSYYNSSGLWGQAYGDLWGLKKINAEAAWNTTTGSSNIVVADIDTGVDRDHPDLKNNMWVNSKEIPNNGIDDDTNAFVDDYYGWDFANFDNDPMDDNGHGTHTAGTIAGVGNNGQGVAGVAWKAKIMPVKYLDAGGSGSSWAAAQALIYAANMGAKISSNSWGGYDDVGTVSVIDDALNYEYNKGMTIVAAAGNNNTNALSFSPANSNRVIAVAASGVNDQKACFSNYGERIDVAAPGGDSANCGGQDNDILSTKSSKADPYFAGIGSGNAYTKARGTSMAAPHVSGLAALILAKYPNATNDQVRNAIRLGADDLGAAGTDTTYGAGRINASKAITINPTTLPTSTITSPTSKSKIATTSVTFTGTAAGPGFANYKLEIAMLDRAGAPKNWILVKNSSSQVTNASLGSYDFTSLDNGLYNARLTVTDSVGRQFVSNVYFLQVEYMATGISAPSYKISKGINEIKGASNAYNGLTFDSYKLEWGEGSSPTSWSAAGIVLASKTSPSPKVTGTLGSWDASALNDGQTYTLRLTTITKQGKTQTDSMSVVVDKDIQPGWPKTPCSQSGKVSYSAYAQCRIPRTASTLADLDRDGKPEVVYGYTEDMIGFDVDKIVAYKSDGSMLQGFPYTLPNSDFASFWDAQILVTDLNGDGPQELIFNSCPNDKATQHKCSVNILNANGTEYAGWQKPSFWFDDVGWSISVPAVADLNGDGIKEIVVFDRPDIEKNPDAYDALTTPNSRIHAYTLTGAELPGFPVKFTHNIPHGGDVTVTPDWVAIGFPTPEFSPTLITDIDDDGKNDIIWGISNQLFAFDNTGKIKPGWPFTAPNDPDSGKQKVLAKLPFVGDFDGDGQKEVGTVGYDIMENTDYSRMYVLNKNGQIQSGWPKRMETSSATLYDSASVRDLNNDGKDDILTYACTSYPRDENTKCPPKIFFGGGAEDTAFQSAIKANDIAPYGLYSLPLFDRTGDKTIEFLANGFGSGAITATNVAGQNIWTKKNGTLADSRVTKLNDAYPTGYATIADIDADNKMEVAIKQEISSTAADSYYFADQVSVYKIPNDNSQSLPKANWRMHAQNVDNNTRAEVPPSVPSGLNLTALNSSQVKLTWRRAVDASPRVAYTIYRNGVAVGASAINGTEYTDNNLQPNTQYSYSVEAFDLRYEANSIPSIIKTVTTKPKADTVKPTAPSNLTGSALSTTKVSLKWTASSDNVGVTGYFVVRNGATIATLGNVTSYEDTTATAGASYVYTVYAKDADLNYSPQSNTATVIMPSDPSTVVETPTNVTASLITPTQINVAWKQPANTTAIELYRNGALYKTFSATNSNGYGDTGLQPSTTYSYYVKAKNAAGNTSAASPTVSATTPAATTTDTQKPVGPATISTVFGNYNGYYFNVKWPAATDNVGVTKYQVKRNNALLAEVPGTQLSYADRSLKADTTYTYQVFSLDAAGLSSSGSATKSVVMRCAIGLCWQQ